MAWSVVAALAGSFEVGFVIALVNSYIAPAPIIAAGVVLLLSLYFVFAPVMHTWPFRGHENVQPVHEPDAPAEAPRRYGYIGREGSRGDLSQAIFSDNLDVAIDNRGDIDASHAAFGEAHDDE